MSNGAIEGVKAVGRGNVQEDGKFFNPENDWKHRLHNAVSIHNFAAENPNLNIQTSGASIW